MVLTKLKIAATVVSIGLIGTGVGIVTYPRLAAQPLGQNNVTAPTPAEPAPPIKPLSRFDQGAANLANTDDGLPRLGEAKVQALLAQSKASEKLKVLLKARYDMANVEAHARWSEFQAGRGTLDFLFGASRHLLDAERELSERKADQIAALERYLWCMREIEKVNQQRFDNGRLPIQDVAEARYNRIQAEIWLERAKAE
jgi:hypothetical protein